MDVAPDFVADLGDKWLEYDIFHHNIQEWKQQFEKQDSELPDFFVTSDQIDWTRRIAIQAAIQNNIDHSISSTINLPKGTSSSVVSELYLLGWKKGLKGITVYVDGSRSGVLVSNDFPSSTENFPENLAPKRPNGLT